MSMQAVLTQSLTTVQLVSAWLLPVLLAITLHEVAHGWTARHFGDPTAARLGRLSLNPLRHIDPVGTVLVPALMLLMPGGVVFGWARPVPVDWRLLHNPKRDMVWVAAAGPGSNLLMGAGWALCIRAAGQLPADSFVGVPLLLMGVAGVFINSVLAVLNMLPLPPLDGGRVLTGLLPMPYAMRFARIERWGMWILIALLLSGLLGWVLWPGVRMLVALLLPLSGLRGHQFYRLLEALS